jgi:hypothetical protein|tara:strand:- start:29 stop:403 length:375 start_codon:yes stop_codon:yes gene_type:complete
MKKPTDNTHPQLNLLFNLEKKLQKEKPEQCLFIAVVLQALLDASKPTFETETEAITENRERAKAWFFASVGVTCKDYIEVCDHAGIDYSDTRVFAHQLIQSNHKTRIRKRINLLLRKELPIKIM